MATIEQAIRTMLTKGTVLSAAGVPDARVTHGYRLQDSDLPAVTYSVSSKEPAALTGANSGTLTINCIATTSASALGIADALRSAIVPDSYDAVVITAAFIVSEQLEPEVVGLGDEQEPAIATTTASIFWST